MTAQKVPLPPSVIFTLSSTRDTLTRGGTGIWKNNLYLSAILYFHFIAYMLPSVMEFTMLDAS